MPLYALSHFGSFASRTLQNLLAVTFMWYWTHLTPRWLFLYLQHLQYTFTTYKNLFIKWNLRFLWRWWWLWRSFGIWCHVTWQIFINILEISDASVFKRKSKPYEQKKVIDIQNEEQGLWLRTNQWSVYPPPKKHSGKSP